MVAHLNARSHFSLGESLLTPKELVTALLAKGATAVALTDTMRIAGMPEFVSACKGTAIKPIIGARLRIVNEIHHDKVGHKANRAWFLRVLVRDQRGYQALLALLSRGFDEKHFYFVPKLTLSDVCECLGAAGAGACLVTLGDAYSAHAAGMGRQAAQALRAAGIAVVSEITPLLLPHYLRAGAEALALVEEGVPILITLPTLYKDKDQADSLDLLNAIANNTYFDERSTKHFWRDYTARDEPELKKMLANYALELAKYTGQKIEAVMPALVTAWRETQSFPATVSYVWAKSKPSMPVMAPDEFRALVAGCQAGWVKRFAAPVYGHKPTDMEVYRARLRYELGVLQRLDFSAYFLLVAEIVTWSKNNGIRVGPARGSVGGSLVAYLMGITDIDPIRFGLLFERFINADRIDLPDADLDFMSTRREEVATWIKERFGEAYVAGVSNYTTMQAAGALRDTCSKLGILENPIAFGKMVPKEHGQSLSLDEALEQVPEMEKFGRENPEVIRHARNIEDRMRSYGKHAAGIVVAGVPLSERSVVETRGDAGAVVNWDKRLVEDFGLVKIDVLGLGTLDMMDITLAHIRKLHGITIEPENIGLAEEDVLDAFGRGETAGVFQFESAGMRKLLRDIAGTGRLTFDDITATTALYRPGPMDSGLMALFVKIKQGLVLPSYPHPSMEDALNETYGVMVYQEQVMQVSRDFGGFTLIEADHLRKAMGKKDKDKMAEMREKFVQGAVDKHAVTDGFAGEIFDQIEKFAGYGFNKSHASAYALISYTTMWLKVKYPIEFFAGFLTMAKSDRRVQALADMKRMGLKLLPPDINASSNIFEPLHRTVLLAPFSALKGLTDKTAAVIVTAREAGLFLTKRDFIDRVERRLCNVKHQGILDKVGAFASIEPVQPPATDPSRRRDQAELMEGLVSEAVVIDRDSLVLDRTTVQALSSLIEEYRGCDKCELKGLCHPKPWLQGPARVMIVLDGPNYKEEGADEMGHGSYLEALEASLGNIGLSRADIYITSLIKSPKPEKTKKWSNTTISECGVWLDKEIAILKPPVVILLGTLTAQHFVKDLKGGLMEHAGRVLFDKTRDCNLVVGINPATIFFDPSKQDVLDRVIAKIQELLVV